MALDVQEFADALRLGVARSGLADGRRISEANYTSLAGTILEYLKTHMEVTLPAGTLQVNGDNSEPNEAVQCEVK
jgi:hypothetical protein